MGLPLQRSALAAREPFSVPPIVGEVLRSAGQPLDQETRSFFEPRLGHDFSQVRVYSGVRAAESARAVNSLAFTFGRDIVFGKGQFEPRTRGGRRLLAHELTHVVQQEQFGGGGSAQYKEEIVPPGDASEQEADAAAQAIAEGTPLPAGGSSHRRCERSHVAMIQRTPAPPSYDGVTGVRDLSKLRIDPVPDLETRKFFAPLDVKPHAIDPAIVHLTWMIFDPKDKMIDGFSTLPKQRESTTKPFTLKPSHFSRLGFLPGKYILRCAGLNHKAQPIVFADRDITVVKSDLTTGTDLATTYGKLTFTKYAKKDASPPATPKYKVDVEIKFVPDKKVSCDNVTYIQAVESVDATGKSQHRFSSAEIEARQTPLAWSIDQLAGVGSPYYIKGKDPEGKVVDLEGYGKAGKGGAAPVKATLIDKPQWDKATNDKFETCVICRSGANKGEVYGCATWGFTSDASAKVTLGPRTFRATPSDQFKEAVDAWNNWRKTIAAASRPAAAPALKTP